MTISAFQFYSITQLYNRISKLKASGSSEKETERKDIVSISSEAKKRQLLEQTKKEVLEKIKRVGAAQQ
jgi:hypothetical protein